jgi:Subtilase family
MDPALWELLRSSTVRNDEAVEAIIRLDRPDADVAGVRIVSRFGPIATCRIRKDSILDARGDESVRSLKAARELGPEQQASDDVVGAFPLSLVHGDRRRPPDLPLTGAGVVVGFVDWGCDFSHTNFRRPDGSTRLLALWDQRGPGSDMAPRPYGYGVLHTQRQINDALRAPDPYDALGYHPADADRDGSGAHGTHVMDIAVGNGRAGGPIGIAPRADPVFVHLADRETGGLANLGDSVRILEAIDFIAKAAGHRPWVINLSVGRHGGPHDGCTLAELALDYLLRAAPNRLIVQSAGNYFDRSTHASGHLVAAGARSLTFITDERDLTPNELEVWYSGDDEFTVWIESPSGDVGPRVLLGEDAEVLEDDRVLGRLYHREHDPNNCDNHVELFLYPWAPAGRWRVTLEGTRVRNGVFHAWLERDEACGHCQARFVDTDADSACTTGTIANGRLPLVVGAYDAHSPTRELAPFSSAGPTRDGRAKPDLVAPGVQVLAARSTPLGSRQGADLLARKSGTSMAAPSVTGAAALCLQAATRPLAAGDIRDVLLTTAEPLASDSRHSSRFGCGYLDIANVVAVASAPNWAITGSRRSIDMKQERPGIEEMAMETDLERLFPAHVRPEQLYREIVYRRGGPLSAWIDEHFDLLARPGESPTAPPEAEDVLVRVALGEPGIGHVAVLSDSSLTPRNSLDLAHIKGERGGPGLYTTVIEDGAFPHARSDRFARRVLDQAGRMPLGQVLLRPKRSLEPDADLVLGSGVDDLQPAETVQAASQGVAIGQPVDLSATVKPDERSYEDRELAEPIRSASGARGSQIEAATPEGQVRVSLASTNATPPLTQRCGFFDLGGRVLQETNVRDAVVEVAQTEQQFWLGGSGGALLQENVNSQFGHLVRYWLEELQKIPAGFLITIASTATNPATNYGQLLGGKAVAAATIDAEARRVAGDLVVGVPNLMTPPNLEHLVAQAVRNARESKLDNIPWSGAFINSCVRWAEFNLNLEGTIGGGQQALLVLSPRGRHWEYTLGAHRRRFGCRQPDGSFDANCRRGGTYHAFRTGERAPQAGDIIVQDRQAKKLANVWRFDHIPNLPNLQGRNLHGDIVIDVQPTFAETIGGNVLHSVRRRRYPLDANGMLVVAKNQRFVAEGTAGAFPALPAVTAKPQLNTSSTGRIFALLSPVEECMAVPLSGK